VVSFLSIALFIFFAMDGKNVQGFYQKLYHKKLSRAALLKKRLKLQDLPSSHKKFIIIQVDGLSYSLLQDLRKTRYIPFLKKLLTHYHVNRYDPGYPSTTPFVQAGIMYNDNFNIPGFRFLDKKTQKQYTMGVAENARAIEQEISSKNYGILTGGTSIGNIFCGGAERSILTVAHLYKTESGQKKVRDILALILLNPLATLKVFYSSILEFCIELYESFLEIVTGLVRGKHFNWPFFFPYFPFFRTFVNATVREISTEAALLEMQRNVPYIYLTYGGYDWISHYRGPESLSAFTLLRGIDADVKKLYKIAKKNNYDFYVLSDHGQVPAIPFDRLYYESFESYVSKISNLQTKTLHSYDERNSRMKYVYYKLHYYYEHISFPLRIGVHTLLKFMGRQLRKEKDPRIDWKNRKQILMLYSSSLAQMYFTDSTHRCELAEIEKKYPGFVERLVSHPGVGFVIGKQGNSIEIIHAKGRVIISGKDIKFSGERFLQIYGDEKKLIKQITYFAQLKYSGDLILNGAFDGKRIIAFEHFHFGSHDSIGGRQSDAFLISRDKVSLDHVINAKELYGLFFAYHEAKKRVPSDEKLYKSK